MSTPETAPETAPVPVPLTPSTNSTFASRRAERERAEAEGGKPAPPRNRTSLRAGINAEGVAASSESGGVVVTHVSR